MRYALALLMFVVGFSFCGEDEKSLGPIQFGRLLCDGEDVREVSGPEPQPIEPPVVASSSTPQTPSGIFALGTLLAMPNSGEFLPADDPSRLIAYAHKVKKKQSAVAVDIAHVILDQGENAEAWKLLETVKKSGAPSRRLIELVKKQESRVGYQYLSRLYKSVQQEEMALFSSERAEGRTASEAQRACAKYCMDQSEKESNKAAVFLANSQRKSKKHKSADVKSLQAKVLESQSKSEELSKKAYNYLAQALLKTDDGEVRGRIQRDLGLCAMKSGGFELASEHFQSAIELGDHESWIHGSEAFMLCDGPTSKNVYTSMAYKREAQNLVKDGSITGKVAQEFRTTLAEVTSNVRGLQRELRASQARGIGVVMDRRDHVLIAAYQGLFERDSEALVRISRALAEDNEHALAADAARRSYKLKPNAMALQCFCGNMSILERTETSEYYEQLQEMKPSFPHIGSPLGYIVCASYCNTHGDRAGEKHLLMSALAVGQGTEQVWEFLARLARTDDELLVKLTSYLDRKSDIHGLEQLGRQLSLSGKSDIAEKLLLQAQSMGSDFATLCLVYQRYLILEREKTTLAQYFTEHPEQLKIDEEILQSHMTNEVPRVACLARMLLRQFYGQKGDSELAAAYAMRAFYMQVGEVWHELVNFQLDDGRFSVAELQVLQSDLKYDGEDPECIKFKEEAQKMHAELKNRDTPLTPWEKQFLDAANNPDFLSVSFKISPPPCEHVGLAILANDGPPEGAMIVSASRPSPPSSNDSRLEEVDEEVPVQDIGWDKAVVPTPGEALWVEEAPVVTKTEKSAKEKKRARGKKKRKPAKEEEKPEETKLEKPKRPTLWGDYMVGLDNGIEYASDDEGNYGWDEL